LKLIALVKKEAQDILGNRIFLLVVLVQLLIILGTFGLAISTALVNDPAVIDSYGVNSAFKVGLSGELNQSALVNDLEAQKLQIEYFNTASEAKGSLGTDIVAIISISSQGEVQVEFDTSNVFYPVASTKISKAVDAFQLRRSLQSRDLSEEQIKVIQEPVKLRVINLKEDEAVNIALDSPYFVEVMYGFIVPFILLLPFFMASNLVTDSIVGEKERKTFEVLLMTPLSSSMVVMGKIIPILGLSLLQSLFWIFLLDWLQVPIFNTLLLLVVLFFVGLGFIGVGILISVLVDSTKEANSAITLILVFATFILFVPLFIKSDLFQVLFNFIPTVLMVKIASSPVIKPEIMIYSLPTILISILIFLVTVRSFRHERAIRL
jgi:ABC-2 type transport system permease protein